ncbi:hypothetical protein M9H77_11282 [Catharanthus roseus]|uniref:Uncharacterized protein n=1 Tax=Catharanthus roseus TaxID=4058 RepID=A0ACC0BE69_CATRO|nr:hypothetical protein M9H77_11282 [Catharanthus roseus]
MIPIFLTPYDDPMGLNRKIRFELVRDARPGQPELPIRLCLFIFFLSLSRLAMTAALLRLFSFCAAARCPSVTVTFFLHWRNRPMALPLAFPIGETGSQGGNEKYYCIQQVVSESGNDYNFPVLFSGTGDLSKIPDLRELLSSLDPAGFPSLGRSLTRIESNDSWKNIVRGGDYRFFWAYFFPIFFMPIFLTPYDDPIGLNRKIKFELIRDAGPGRANSGCPL